MLALPRGRQAIETPILFLETAILDFSGFLRFCYLRQMHSLGDYGRRRAYDFFVQKGSSRAQGG